jgi:hypothetical protein
VAEPARDQIRILAQAYDYLVNHSESSRVQPVVHSTDPYATNNATPDRPHTEPDSSSGRVE